MKSDQIKKGPERAPARAMLRATGLDDEQIYRPMTRKNLLTGPGAYVLIRLMYARDQRTSHVAIRASGGHPSRAVELTLGLSLLGSLLALLLRTGAGAG